MSIRRNYWQLIKETAIQFWRRGGPRNAAALAFYTILSLSPLLVVLIAIAGFVFGEAAARGELAQQIRDSVGDEGAQAVQAMLSENRSTQRGVLMTIVGAATLFLGASGAIGQFQSSLNAIFDDKRSDRAGIFAVICDRLLSFAVVGSVALLLAVSLAVSAILSGIHGWLDRNTAVGSWTIQICNQVISFVLTSALFVVMFKVLPRARPGWSEVWIGSLITAGLFVIGKFLIGAYLGQIAPASACGAAGSLVVLLLWIYYSAHILLFGTEFTRAYGDRFGTGLRPILEF